MSLLGWHGKGQSRLPIPPSGHPPEKSLSRVSGNGRAIHPSVLAAAECSDGTGSQRPHADARAIRAATIESSASRFVLHASSAFLVILRCEPSFLVSLEAS